MSEASIFDLTPPQKEWLAKRRSVQLKIWILACRRLCNLWVDLRLGRCKVMCFMGGWCMLLCLCPSSCRKNSKFWKIAWKGIATAERWQTTVHFGGGNAMSETHDRWSWRRNAEQILQSQSVGSTLITPHSPKDHNSFIIFEFAWTCLYVHIIHVWESCWCWQGKCLVICDEICVWRCGM